MSSVSAGQDEPTALSASRAVIFLSLEQRDLSTCRQLRLTITGLYRNIEEFPMLCMCLPFGYSTFLRQILHRTSFCV